jgi:hypothetical protein
MDLQARSLQYNACCQNHSFLRITILARPLLRVHCGLLSPPLQRCLGLPTRQAAGKRMRRSGGEAIPVNSSTAHIKRAGGLCKDDSDLDARSRNALAVTNNGSAHHAWEGCLWKAVPRKAAFHVLQQTTSSHRGVYSRSDNSVAKVVQVTPSSPCALTSLLVDLNSDN